MYFDDDLYPEALKASFLDTAIEMVPELRRELQGEPLRLYNSIPRCDLPLRWGGYSNTSDFHRFKAAIEAWAERWNLNADWCKSAAYFTIQIWSDAGRPAD